MAHEANINVPKRGKEVDASRFAQPAQEIIEMPPLDAALEHGENIIEVDEEALQKEYAEKLAFNEEPITILINPSNEKFPAPCIDCWVNGRGAEVWMNGRWTVTGAIPVGMEVITKRKYAELIMRAKRENAQTRHEDANVEKPRNFLDRNVARAHAVNVIEDRNPKGTAWLSNVMRGRY